MSIASHFNDYFTNIGPKLANSIGQPKNNYDFTKSLPQPLNNSIFLTPITQEEVSDIISNLNINKSPGIDGYSNKVLKSVSTIISTPLSHLFNFSLLNGIFPDSYYKSKIKNE